MRVIDRDELERALAKVQREVRDPRAGLFGPNSPVWRLSRESVLLLGGGRAALMQLAHPFVARAITEHSHVQSDVQGRFRRTFMRMFAMVFGDLDNAVATARQVHRMHATVHGNLAEPLGRFATGARYAANDAEALLWVSATLTDTTVHVYEDLVSPLSDAEKAAFYEDGRPMTLLFGIPPELLPPDWPAFQRYVRATCDGDMLAVGSEARTLAARVLSPPNLAIAPLYRWGRLYTAATLPEKLRLAYGLRYGAAERLAYAAAVRSLRAALPVLPPQLRYFPAYLNAQRRLAGQPGPDRVGRAFTAVFLEALQQRPSLRRLLQSA